MEYRKATTDEANLVCDIVQETKVRKTYGSESAENY